MNLVIIYLYTLHMPTLYLITHAQRGPIGCRVRIDDRKQIIFRKKYGVGCRSNCNEELVLTGKLCSKHEKKDPIACALLY